MTIICVSNCLNYFCLLYQHLNNAFRLQMRRLLAPNTKKAGKTRTMYFPTAHSCNLRYEWNHRNSFHHCEDFSWATRSEGRHISTRRRLKKRSHTPKTVSYFKAKVLTSTTRIVSFEAKKAVWRFQSPPFTIYG